jgi:hypothetical protein
MTDSSRLARLGQVLAGQGLRPAGPAEAATAEARPWLRPHGASWADADPLPGVEALLALPRGGPARREHLRRMIRHRRQRSLGLGPCMRLQFEDMLTLQHQVHEVMRAEGCTDATALQHELDRYAHLRPDGLSWKATLMIELPQAEQRQRALPALSEAVHAIYLELPRHSRAIAQANEDLPDRHRGRPSAVHFLRFALDESQRQALRQGGPALLGCAHDAYAFRRALPLPLLARLRRELWPAARPAVCPP